MAYSLKAVTIRTNNTGKGMADTEKLWEDILSGRIPLLFDSEGGFREGVSPVSRYSNYERDESGDYDLTVMAVYASFFREMEEKTAQGLYRRYFETDENGDMAVCAKKAWERVWSDKREGVINRSFSEDYESTVPKEYTKDGKAHCYLYIALQPAFYD